MKSTIQKLPLNCNTMGFLTQTKKLELLLCTF